jgi:predicted tellurium resistance membrane protein TerC
MDFSIFSEPSTWFSILTLTFMEVILGIDNIIFISITAGKLPKHQQARARRIGLLVRISFQNIITVKYKMDYWVKRTFASHIWIWNFRKKHNSADWRYFPDGEKHHRNPS